MSRDPMILKKGEGERLRVLGADVTFLCRADHTGKAWSVMEASLPRDAGPPLHEHPWDEAYYVVQGEIHFTLGDRSTVLRAGDFAYAPGGTLHAFRGAAAEPARVLVFDAPAAAEAFFRDVDREVKEYPRDLVKVPEIGSRHKLRFIER